MEIFLIKISAYDNLSESDLISYKKREISNEKRLREHCLAYYLLDKILEEKYLIEDRTIDFIGKKPVLKNGGKYFSISHSKDYIVLAISDYNCGIDIEYQKERKNYLDIAKRMNFSCKTIDEFYKEWTMFEANYKLGEDIKLSESFEHENYSISVTSINEKEKLIIKNYIK